MTGKREVERLLEDAESDGGGSMALPSHWNPKGSGPLVVNRQAFKSAWIESASGGSPDTKDQEDSV